MRLVFDTNALVAAGGRGLEDRGLRVSVPLVVLQELMYQLAWPGRAEPARGVLHALDRVGYELLPGFADTVWEAFGLGARFWPDEQGFWRTIASVAPDVGWGRVQRWWDARWQRQRTASPGGLFERMKSNGEDFVDIVDVVVGLLGPERRAETDRQRLAGRTRAEIRADLDARSRRILLLTTITEIAACADVPGAQEVLNFTMDNPELDEAVRARVDLGNHLWIRYRGGIDFALSLLTQVQRGWIEAQQGADRNDPFDLEVLCAVDDDPATLLVTNERRWHRMAAEAGLGDRIVRLEDLQGRLVAGN